MQVVERQVKDPAQTQFNPEDIDHSYHPDTGVRLCAAGPQSLMRAMRLVSTVSQCFARRKAWNAFMQPALEQYYHDDKAMLVRVFHARRSVPLRPPFDVSMQTQQGCSGVRSKEWTPQQPTAA
jgi:hypothetical protein